MMKNAVLAASLLLMLGLAAGVAVYAWRELGDVEIGLLGWLAMGGGAFFTLALGIGLMWLVFKSERDGAGPDEHGPV